MILSVPGNAKITPWPLDRIVNSSVLIMVGTVENVERTGRQHQGFEELKVRFAVERVLKGHAESHAVFFTLKSAPEFPSFDVGQHCLLFVSHFEGQLWVTQGANGKITIDGNKLRDVYIVGESVTQSLAGFLRKIERVIARATAAKQ